MSKRFSFIIPTIKATLLVKDCVDSLRKNEPDDSRYEILVIDDGSDQHVQNWLKQYCDENGIKLFLKETNQGFSHSVNTGLRNSSGDIRILLNNDVVFTKPVLNALDEAFALDPKIGVIGAKLLYPDGRIQHAGVVRVPRSYSFIHINKHVASVSQVVNESKFFPAVTGALFAIKKEVLDTVGLFNEQYFIACEDVEFCIRTWLAGYKVYYAHTVEAIHIEGFTRGNNDTSKLKKGPEWYVKERETISKFYNDLKKYDLDHVEMLVATAKDVVVVSDIKPSQGNAVQVSEPLKKLEIGCGSNPQPGYLHLDVRQLPHVEYVCNFEKEKLPIGDSELDEILSNHSIEHISWRSLPFVLTEWFRVLKPGGRVFLRTPDLEFICRTYLDGRTTPEWPGDEDFIRRNLSADITPSWWANIKLYAGQDYTSNFHYLCFDLPMIKSLFERIGFTNVARLSTTPVFSPGELQVEAYKPGAKEGNISVRTQKVLVKRRGALGDVILTTPIIRRLKSELPFGSSVNVATDCGAIFINNPCIDMVFPANQVVGEHDRIIDLDLCYEKNPNMHIIDAYSMAAFGDTNYDKSTTLIPTDADKQIVTRKLEESGLNPAECVVVHMAVTWKNRTWPKEYWSQAIKKITDGGQRVILIGSGGDFTIKQDFVYDFTRTITLHQIAELISRCACFVGNDSGMLHIAGTTETPIVGLFTSAKGEYRVPFRNGEYGYKCTILKPSVDCYGCLARETPPVVFCDCRRGDYICLSQITPEHVYNAVRKHSGSN